MAFGDPGAADDSDADDGFGDEGDYGGWDGSEGLGNTPGVNDGGRDDNYYSYANPGGFNGSLWGGSADVGGNGLSSSWLTGLGNYLDTIASQSDITNFNNTSSFSSKNAYETALNALQQKLDQRRLHGQTAIGRYGDMRDYNENVMNLDYDIRPAMNQVDAVASFLNSADINDYENFDLSRPSATDISGFESRADRLSRSPDLLNPDVDLSGFGGALSSAVLPDVNALSTQYNENTTGLNSLGSQFDTALDADEGFLQQLQADINRFNRGSENADIYGTGVVDSMSNEYNDLLYGLDLFDPMLDSTQGRIEPVQNQLDEIGQFVGDSQATYGAESDRLNSYIDQFNRDITGLGSSIDDFDISNIDGINSSDSELDALMSHVLGFQTPIQFDPTSQIGRIEGLDNRIDTLRSDRTAEQGRIENARTGFLGQLRNLERGVEGADIYGGDVLSNLEFGADSLRDSATNFDSLLNPTFEGVDSGLASFNQQISDLMSQRGTRIGDINTDVAAALAEGEGVELHDERGITSAQRDIQTLMDQLSRFTGNVGQGINTANYGAEDALSSLDSRMNDLGDYRSGIESDAASLLSSIDPNLLYRNEDVQGFRDQLAPILSERDLYNAIAANNEVTDIQDILGSADTRLAGDAAAVAERTSNEAQASERALNGGINRDLINQQLSSGQLTTEEYFALLGKVKDEDPEFANLIEQQYSALYV